MEGFEEFDFAKPQFGVYVLKLKNQIVYIGKSTYVYDRVINHYRARKIKFDKAYIKLCSTQIEMDGLEYKLISANKPKHNRKDLGYGDIAPSSEAMQFIIAAMSPST